MQSYDWFSSGANNGGYVSLTRCPPSQKSVMSWLSKQRKKRKNKQLCNEQSSKRERAKMGVVDKKETDHLAGLVLDGISRKLVAEKPDGTSDDDISDKIYGKRVEEVAWCSSQQMSQSETPLPVAEKPNARDGVDETPDKKLSTSSQETRCDELSSSISRATPPSIAQSIGDALDGMGNQGGKLYVDKGGRLKAETKPSKSVSDGYLPTPVTVMSIEVHVQCRTGRAGVNDSKQISMVPYPEKDQVSTSSRETQVEGNHLNSW